MDVSFTLKDAKLIIRMTGHVWKNLTFDSCPCLEMDTK